MKEHTTKSMSDLLGEMKNKPAKRSSEDKAPHERAYYVELTRKFLGNRRDGTPYTFGQVNGLTRSWSMEKIRDRYYFCTKHAKNPVKTWWGLRKQDLGRPINYPQSFQI